MHLSTDTTTHETRQTNYQKLSWTRRLAAQFVAYLTRCFAHWSVRISYSLWELLSRIGGSPPTTLPPVRLTDLQQLEFSAEFVTPSGGPTSLQMRLSYGGFDENGRSDSLNDNYGGSVPSLCPEELNQYGLDSD